MEEEQKIQSSLIIVWNKNATEEQRQEAIANLYINNENLIDSMEVKEMKKGVDISQAWKKLGTEEAI